MFQPVQAALSVLLEAIKPQPIRRDGRTHLIADPPLSRTDAVEWLWEGRLDPDSSRFRPDPLTQPADGPQGRFLFNVTPEEFVETRQSFKDRYLSDGPGWTLRERLIAAAPWLPNDAIDQIIQQDEAGYFRRKLLPRIIKFPGTAPWGEIVAWAGMEGTNFVIEVFNYFPEDEEFYTSRANSERQGRLVHKVMTAWNRDMQLFVEERGMQPSLAREELRRVSQAIFLAIIGVVADVFIAGGSEVAAQKIAQNSDQIAEALQQAYDAGRKLFSLSLRRNRRTILLFRGTTLRMRFGDATQGLMHDLGDGIYFTDNPSLATLYANKWDPPEERIILQAEAKLEELGEVLDLINGPHAQKWDELVEMRGTNGLWNEAYQKLLTSFLNGIGRTIGDFETIIAREYLNRPPRIQIRIRRDSPVYYKILERCIETSP